MDYKEIAAICEKYHIQNWTIDNNGLVDVDSNVDLTNKELTELPLHFGEVSGYFTCGWNNLTTLKFAPYYVGLYFHCHNNKLISLEHIPEYADRINIMCNYLDDVYNIPYVFNISGNAVHVIYKYMSNIIYINSADMRLMVDISYFKDSKILIGEDIYVDRFKIFLDSYGLNSNINIKELKEVGYTIKL